MTWPVIVLAVAVLVGLLVYVIRKTEQFQGVASGLQAQLTQFKEGGFDRLVSEKLDTLSKRAAEELAARERVILDTHSESLEHQRVAKEAALKFATELGKVETQISSLSDLKTRVDELNDLLKPQQLRGELGEVIVRTLISDKLPRNQFEENYRFRDGKEVEFAIRLNERLVPVDSKLQLEGFRRMREAPDDRQRQTLRTEFKRSIKQKIDEVGQYIRPEEGTHNFALMVVPSEAVYYEVIGHKDFLEEGGIWEHAKTRNVFLVSPLTFWAYLTAIAQGLRGMEIERRAQEILASLQTLSASVRSFAGNEFRLIGEHLRNAANKYEDAKQRLSDIAQGLTTLERAEAPQLTERVLAE